MEDIFSNSKSKILEQLPPDINDDNWPRIRIKTLELINFGIFDHVLIDFRSTNSSVEPLSCLIGPNGTGKTTILSAIQMLFSRYKGYDDKRYKANLLKYVRNYKNVNPKDLEHQNFKISGKFEDDDKNEYEVELTRLSRDASFHPEFVAERLPHYCFCARFDQELHIFQLKRNRWKKFKKLFESITGYEINEDTSIFDHSSDTRINRLLEQYVTSFNIRKNKETINHTQCSAGERKLIKTFSTILNKSVTPSIILIDNTLMHVEVDRHISIVKALKECFDNSQLIITCHSESVRKNLSGKNTLIDMRFLNVSKLIVENPWRLRLIDELKDIQNKLQDSLLNDSDGCQTIIKIDNLLHKIECQTFKNENIVSEITGLIPIAYHIIIKNLMTPYNIQIKNI